MEPTSYIELSESALLKNFSYLRKLAGPNRTISHVVKGNAYGHGIEQYVPLAYKLGARHFATFDAREAYRVKQILPAEIPVMIMGMIDDHQLEWAIQHEVEFFVFNFERLHKCIEFAKKWSKKPRIHIELETGMNRTGFDDANRKKLVEILKANKDLLALKGFCTHYAGAENYANFLRIEHQIQRFAQQKQMLEKQGLFPEKYHTACSAASIRMPQTRMDMVRIGILQYGFWPSKETYITTIQPNNLENKDPLHRVISWKSRIMSIKEVPQGEYVGYGTSFLTSYHMKIATVPVGYGHGFSRSLSNTGRALVNGERVQVAGTVNMNLIMLDVTNLSVEIGDEVVLIGTQNGHTISVSSFSEYSDQLNYELLTRLPLDIPRHVVD